VASSRTIMIAGGGIGGLTAALAIAQQGFRVAVYDQAERLDEVGAGIQLSPNASRVLIGLGLGEQLKPLVVAPNELRVLNAQTARVLAKAPLGASIEARHGAPYWVIHRGDLQSALLAAVRAHPDIALRLGTRVDDFAIHPNGVTIATITSGAPTEERGIALVGADGLWSSLRKRLGDARPPHFARHTAWRALVPAENVVADLREPVVNLVLGRNAHLVHYPVRNGQLINVVAIIRDDWTGANWSEPGLREELMERFPAGMWPPLARSLLLAAPATWRKWALSDRPPITRWGRGPVTLLGDAAHPMLPYLAQGAAMAIEDAAVLAARLAEAGEDVAGAMRRYEQARRRRTARAQRAARRNGTAYHMGGAEAFLRTLAMLAMGGKRLITRYDWLYGWKPA
jgi:salicylate hydroxylase